MPHPDLSAVVQRARLMLDEHNHPIGAVRRQFEQDCASLDPSPSKKAREDAWSEVVGRPTAPQLVAVQPVPRASSTGQVSLYQGDVFALQADQWICSAFYPDVSPTGGAWRSFWRRAARNGGSWSNQTPDDLVPLDPQGQVALLRTCPGAKDGLPTLVLFGRYSPRERTARAAANPTDWPERVYFDALHAVRQLGRTGKLGRRVAMPVLFSELHGVPYDQAIALQRQFALDLVRQEEQVQEVAISVLDEHRTGRLLQAWHLASGDTLASHRKQFPAWLRDTLAILVADLRQSLDHTLVPWLSEALGQVLDRIEADPVYLNDVAVLARSTTERWAEARCQQAGIKATQDLSSMVGQLRGRAGTPHRTLHYLDSIRVLGNVGAHFQKAPHPLEPTDLVTLLLGLQALVRLDKEFGGTPGGAAGS